MGLSRHTVLPIDGSKLIGTGLRRRVYLHPEDDTKVLKVYREERTPARRRAQRWYGRFLPLRHFDESANDYHQYRRVAKRSPGFLAHVCPVFGYVETTLGRALVAERAQNADGTTCETLETYVSQNGLSEVVPVIDGFFEEMVANHVTVGDPTARNIVVRRNGRGLELVLVDGLGDPTIIPYKTVSKRLNRRKLMRKKASLLRKLRALEERVRAG